MDPLVRVTVLVLLVYNCNIQCQIIINNKRERLDHRAYTTEHIGTCVCFETFVKNFT